MAEGIEQLGDIIKDQAKKSRRFNDRLGDLEMKLFGKAREERKKGKTASNVNVAGIPSNINKENSILNTSTNARDKKPKAKKSPLNNQKNKDHSPPVREKSKASKSKDNTKLIEIQ